MSQNNNHPKTLSRHIRELEEDERVRELLKILRERDVGGDNYANAKSRENISAESLDPVRRNICLVWLDYL